MLTDKLFYYLLQNLPSVFFQLIGRNPDDAARYTFESPEIKELSFRIDGVFVPKNPKDVTYFVEIQFQPDEMFYIRFFGEIFLYLGQYSTSPKQLWEAVAIYPSSTIERQSDVYSDMLLLSRFKRIYLDELQETNEIGISLLKLVVEPKETAVERAQRLVTKSSIVELDFIEQILSSKFKELNREEIQAMLGIKEELLKETGFYKQTFEEGKQEGKLEGKQEGKQEGKLETVPLLRRLGLSDEAIARELGLSLADVQRVPKTQ